MGNVTTIAIDLAKRVFQLAGEDARGEEQWQKRLSSREAFTAFIQTLEPPLVVAMEVGLGAQAWARALQARGLTVRLLPAQRVAEHRSGAKNDRNDVRAILRANRDRSIHPAPVKTVSKSRVGTNDRIRSLPAGTWVMSYSPRPHRSTRRKQTGTVTAPQRLPANAVAALHPGNIFAAPGQHAQ